MSERKKRGRPRIYDTDAERIQAYRQRKQSDGSRLDVYINSSANWRLSALANAWGCSRSQVIERLLLEADQRYNRLLFPES